MKLFVELTEKNGDFGISLGGYMLVGNCAPPRNLLREWEISESHVLNVLKLIREDSELPNSSE